MKYNYSEYLEKEKEIVTNTTKADRFLGSEIPSWMFLE
jgi:hypothetical protein